MSALDHLDKLHCFMAKITRSADQKSQQMPILKIAKSNIDVTVYMQRYLVKYFENDNLSSKKCRSDKSLMYSLFIFTNTMSMFEIYISWKIKIFGYVSRKNCPSFRETLVKFFISLNHVTITVFLNHGISRSIFYFEICLIEN